MRIRISISYSGSQVEYRAKCNIGEASAPSAVWGRERKTTIGLRFFLIALYRTCGVGSLFKCQRPLYSMVRFEIYKTVSLSTTNVDFYPSEQSTSNLILFAHIPFGDFTMTLILFLVESNSRTWRRVYLK